MKIFFYLIAHTYLIMVKIAGDGEVWSDDDYDDFPSHEEIERTNEQHSYLYINMYNKDIDKIKEPPKKRFKKQQIKLKLNRF